MNTAELQDRIERLKKENDELRYERDQSIRECDRAEDDAQALRELVDVLVAALHEIQPALTYANDTPYETLKMLRAKVQTVLAAAAACPQMQIHSDDSAHDAAQGEPEPWTPQQWREANPPAYR